MGTMEDYCKAIQEAKLSSKPGPRGTRFYNEASFCEFINREIDMRDLRRHMADFSEGAGMAQTMHTIRSGVQSVIPQKLGYGGNLSQIGSFYDGSKTGRLNEMDCLYVVNESDVVVRQIRSGGGYFEVFVKGIEVKPREINQKLIAAMKDTLSEMSLPDGWIHGGYASREFSGVRCNGPAVTAMFSNKEENHISLDISIAFPLTDHLQKVQDFPGQLKNNCRSLTGVVANIQSEVPRTAIAPADLHLIGDLVDNTWKPTTALAEAEILRVLDPECSAKGTLDICKVIASKQQIWYEENNTHSERLQRDEEESVSARSQRPSSTNMRGLTLATLTAYMKADPGSQAQLRDKINTDMAFQHIWLSSSDRHDYKEVLKADASINTAAMKHIILNTALQMKCAFSRQKKTFRECLLRAVFEELSDPRSVYTQHAFLHGVELPKFSISSTLSDIKDDVARDIQEQCQLILDHGLKKVLCGKKSKGSMCQAVSMVNVEQNPNLGDYYYTLGITLSTNGCCSVSKAEQIAVVMSAMMNTSGGVLVLEVQTDTEDVGPGRCDVNLKEFGSNLLTVITAQEKWIPEHVVSRYVKQCVQEKSSKILFFLAKAKDLVTHCSYAYILHSSDVKLTTDHNVTCRMLQECSCTHEDKCQHHEDRLPELQSALSDADRLNVDTCLPYTLRTQYICRYYQLHNRSLTEILCTQSVSSEIKELVSALANTDGGSILLGVTYTESPIVKGYTLGDISVHQLNECLSRLINGQGGTDTTIWSTVNPVHENWKFFLHPMSSDDVIRHVIEIRVRKCPGGMFCSMPLCFEVRHSGEILPMNHFGEWKQKMLFTYKPEAGKVVGNWKDHFRDPDTYQHSDIGMLEEQTPSRLQTTVGENDCQTSKVFQWWLTNNENITSEALSFDQCCARELADDAININKPFMLFPSVQTAMGWYEDATDIHSALTEIEEKYRDGNGAAVIIQKMADHLTGERKDILYSHHVCDIVVLKAKSRPSVISVMRNYCDKAVAEHYNRTLVCHLKRLCLLTYRHLCDSSTHLCFQRHLYYIGSGFDSAEENVKYPEEYLRPTIQTLDIVRCTLAGILLQCEQLTDRFGDIMVRHLSFIQAKILWGERSKVTVVEGRAGSGKSVLALETMRRIKQHSKEQSRILFLCRGRGLAAFIKYQTEMMGICVDIQTVQLEKMEDVNDFTQYTDVFIDDAHALPLTGKQNCQDMYHSLFSCLRNPNSHAYILFDLDMQDYRGCIPANFSKEIQSMARKFRFIRHQDVKTKTLEKILRNSSRICQFIGANMEEELDELQSIRNLPEDGAYLYIIDDVAISRKNNDEDGDEEAAYNVRPFSCKDISNALQHKMQKLDFDIAAVETLLRLKELLRDALKGTVFEEQEDDDDDISGRGAIASEKALNRLKQLLREAVKGTVYEEKEEDHDDKSGSGAVAAPEPLDGATLASRLRDILEGTLYEERHITILAENTNWKTWIKENLEGAKYQIQEATSFPVKHIVVDTLDNFEGLDSPVILFIVPESWGTGYIGSLKYRLCIATRAISRLEFLIPWDPTGREQDLVELKRAFRTEPPIDYGRLKVTRHCRSHGGTQMLGMCYFSRKMYTTEQRRVVGSPSYRLAVYDVTDQDTLTPRDTLHLNQEPGHIDVDRQSGRVYIPCDNHGVYVARFDGSKLVPVTILGCVGEAVSVAVVTRDTLYVCNWASKTVCLVDATQDRVTMRLHPPPEVRGENPWDIAVLGDTVLVVYVGGSLVLYRHGVPRAGKVLPKPHVLMNVYALTTDNHSSFLLSDFGSKHVYVLDISGNLTHTIPIPEDRRPRGCIVVGGQLWVGCKYGEIIVMSS